MFLVKQSNSCACGIEVYHRVSGSSSQILAHVEWCLLVVKACWSRCLDLLISELQLRTCSCLITEICFCFRIRITLSRSARRIQMSASKEILQKAVLRAPVPAPGTQAVDNGLAEGGVHLRVERSLRRRRKRTGAHQYASYPSKTVLRDTR